MESNRMLEDTGDDIRQTPCPDGSHGFLTPAALPTVMAKMPWDGQSPRSSDHVK
jgi:hypothetical protein